MREKQELMAHRQYNQEQALAFQNNILSQVKLGIDFTKLAKIAYHEGKEDVSKYLIENEKKIVKKIPFLLQIKKNKEALKIAIDGGDPNNINKVLSETIRAFQGDFEEAVKYVASVFDGLRHFRNFAKKRINEQEKFLLLREIYKF